jgi:hypothetical protein
MKKYSLLSISLRSDSSMGFQVSEKVSWEDIQALYTSLNEARTKFTLAAVEAPTNPGLTKPDSM